MTDIAQRRLEDAQVEAFYHDQFVEDQVTHFRRIIDVPEDGVVVDVGGGCGYFAQALSQTEQCRVRVIDVDNGSIEACLAAGIEAQMDDALSPRMAGDESVICFNLILHHLIGADEKTTRRLQIGALQAWHKRAPVVFVNEYIYESYIGYLSGRLIFGITASRLLSWVGTVVSRFVPSLAANTFGVGVRFRAHQEWERLFSEAGYRVVNRVIGAQEPVALPRRLLFIDKIRRDSFRLEPV